MRTVHLYTGTWWTRYIAHMLPAANIDVDMYMAWLGYFGARRDFCEALASRDPGQVRA